MKNRSLIGDILGIRKAVKSLFKCHAWELREASSLKEKVSIVAQGLVDAVVFPVGVLVRIISDRIAAKRLHLSLMDYEILQYNQQIIAHCQAQISNGYDSSRLGTYQDPTYRIERAEYAINSVLKRNNLKSRD